MIALLPESSSRHLPKRPATRIATSRPTREEPVKDSSATAGSSTSRCASALPGPSTSNWNTGGAPQRSSTALQIFCTAMAVSGALGEGFQTVALPQIAARNAFQLHTATGKLKALMTPTTPSGCHSSRIA